MIRDYFSTLYEDGDDNNDMIDFAEEEFTTLQSLQQLSAIQMAVHPHIKMPKPLDAHAIGLGGQVSVDWNGPVEPILSQITKAAHYKLTILGTEPSIPVLVSVNQRNKTLANLVRNITYQVVHKATIKIFPRSKTIELRYKTA